MGDQGGPEYPIASINYTKNSLSEREKTYRLMLSDLLAVCETAIPDDASISRLDIVVASRTINGIRQTTISDINHDVIGALPSALEIDLATKGLIDLMGKKIKVHMDYANNSWGLVCADFLANINYHYRRENEKNFLARLDEAGKFYLFESFGGIEVRRARVAERNKDYAIALHRWIDIAINSDHTDDADHAVGRLFEKIFSLLGTTGPRVAFESLLDLLWRTDSPIDKYQYLLKKLEYLDLRLSIFLEGGASNKHLGLQFRLRNLTLIVLDHLGRVGDALQLIQSQKAEMPSLVTNPELFHLTLSFKVLETEAYINCIDLRSALELSEKYSELMG